VQNIISQRGVVRLRGHGNNFHGIATNRIICCHRMKMFHCVSTLNVLILQLHSKFYFWNK